MLAERKKRIKRSIPKGDAGMIYAKLIYAAKQVLENIQCLSPIIGSAFPEIKRLIEMCELSPLYDPTNSCEIDKCIEEKLRADSEFYYKCKNNMQSTKKDLCWENEKKAPMDAMQMIL